MGRTTEREPKQPRTLAKKEKVRVKITCHLALVAN